MDLNPVDIAERKSLPAKRSERSLRYRIPLNTHPVEMERGDLISDIQPENGRDHERIGIPVPLVRYPHYDLKRSTHDHIRNGRSKAVFELKWL